MTLPASSVYGSPHSWKDPRMRVERPAPRPPRPQVTPAFAFHSGNVPPAPPRLLSAQRSNVFFPFTTVPSARVWLIFWSQVPSMAKPKRPKVGVGSAYRIARSMPDVVSLPTFWLRLTMLSMKWVVGLRTTRSQYEGFDPS